MNNKYLFTSESVTEGHPDKMCDKISDAILDDIISKDKKAHVACESLTTTGLVLVSGEITTDCYSDIPRVVRDTLKEIGYTNPDYGLDSQDCAVLTSIHEQSNEIAQGVNEGEGFFDEQGAGDQGIMFGYASDETDTLMPLPIYMAHRLTEKLAAVRKEGVLPWVRPDGKSQVTVEYVNGVPTSIDKVVLAVHHDPGAEEFMRDVLRDEVIKPVLGKWDGDHTEYLINTTGIFVKGGPEADTGLTGRKIIVDTYGGMGRHGGGAFSGKDPSKVDRSASYMARYIAKNIVASGIAKKCEVQLAYTIGKAEPVSVFVDTFGTGKDLDYEKLVRDVFPLTPKEIISHLDLIRPIYTETAAYGHFGRELPNFTWEYRDKVDAILSHIG
ncbi:MAG: methionine adenosyltransferase [Candidatus Marinimicrobia bacterium]|jgi:S-adenosylmethionine synthetase|nr:methionine adenosyltransferase [Candidatus Neomarinimicrobiota bacterium]MBT3634792.1 methionine adenosyltransferase [Candidatus Neomarinimicrobiota bacterium]MBT3683594.1 methionine adenosyltransferase [Candidatus Neomarinimicrobiota bacterium]MBT3760445.1 methionine adenosyltransferase [Candidatus Neomarinimicrobiota bacterium]MBT3896591.1 methionine adenosyltransferase [Candidatus Neomarinimicrobiota bacterium]